MIRQNHPHDSRKTHFFEDTVGGAFKPEPATTFIVDRDVPKHVADAVGVALNQGAIVFIPWKEDEYVLGETYDKRFRLSYLLAARYHLPLTYGSWTNLSTVLRGSTATKMYTLNDLFAKT
jgi:hypothetical protein